ncbi:MAG: tRNA pseudouridine(38-40) synthase TruA [Bacteroidetes bacterium]|nr:tRNA pseudouridine(38-40) synthase TruA [Bacteroidota bacterium]
MSSSVLYRYFIRLSFDGTKFHGWQVQQNANSVQGELNKALEILFRKPIETTGCGRTDTGVHALHFFAHFETEEITDVSDLIHKLNSILPMEIAVHSIFKVPPDYHARFSATSRTYEYHIINYKDPFLINRAWYNLNIPEIAELNKFVDVLKEYVDFTSFSKSNTQTYTNNCRIMEAGWSLDANGKKIFTIKADRFLRNMVRAIVGTLIMSAEKNLSEEQFRKILESKNRSEAGVSVPAHGLFLTKIEYPFPLL